MTQKIARNAKVVFILLLLALPTFSVSFLNTLASSSNMVSQPLSRDINSPASSSDGGSAVFEEDFENPFPSAAWYVGDWTPASGLDYWDDTEWNHNGGLRSGWCAQEGTQLEPTPIIAEDFEGTFPGSAMIGDWDSNGGYDFWDTTNYRSYGGTKSAWCAQVGTQTLTQPQIIWSEDFEGAFPGSWLVDDEDRNAGHDMWGKSSYKVHGGSSSVWCAEVGVQGDFGQPNNVVHKYDDYMEADMHRPANLAGYASVSLSYWYWIDSEDISGMPWDALSVQAYEPIGGWHLLARYSGNSGGWQSDTVSVSTSAVYIDFCFMSDSANHDYEGAYIDDVTLSGVPIAEQPNASLLQYDNDQRSYMFWLVDLEGYWQITLSYRYWTNWNDVYDHLEVMYRYGAMWYYTDLHSGDSGGWQSSTSSISSDATAIGFCFHSDSSTHDFEGAYVDDILLQGYRRNANMRLYDDNMQAYMFREVDLSDYTSVSLSYWYLIDTEVNNDYLQVMYYTDTMYYIDTHTGVSGLWQSSTVSIPTSAVYIGFLFHSDSSDHLHEGAYIDDIVCIGIKHDVACDSVIPFRNIVYQGYSLEISVTVTNQGDYTETFGVTCYADTTPIKVYTCNNVPSGASAILIFEWDPAGWQKKDYIIWAFADTVPEEKETTDNTYTYGIVSVIFIGDINRDRNVNVYDLFSLGKVYNSDSSQPNFDTNCDFNGDNKVNSSDLSDLGNNYGKIDP